MATTDRVLRQRVERGAALLDAELGPEWPERIDVPTLDIADGDHCVLGQVYEKGFSRNGYSAGLHALSGTFGLNTYALGFNADPDTFTRLLPLWREAIEARTGTEAA